MKNSKSTDRSPEKANAALDALLHRGVLADKRATKPPFPAVTPSPTPQPVPSPNVSAMPAPAVHAVPRANPTLERLTIRFTQDEARLLEKARGIARSMGFKVSDTAVFRLALNAFQSDRMTPQSIEAVLAADSRRRQN